MGILARDRVLSGLQAQIGQETYVGDWLTVTQDMIDLFADATCDHQWIHVDAERTRTQSPYGTTIAHGFFTLSLIPFLTESVNPDKPLFPDVKMGVNYGLNRVRFPNAVPAGARIRARTTLVSAEPVNDDAIQTVRQVIVEIEGQEKPACAAETVARYYFNPG
jgi:acyl dehydratase